MFKKNKEKKGKSKTKTTPIQEVESLEIDLESSEQYNKEILTPYTRTIKDLFSPYDISMPAEDHMIINNKYVKSFTMQGYPSTVQMKWLDPILNYDGNMDTSIYVEPADDRQAQEELTKKITQYEAQLAIEEQKGRVTHTTELRNKIESLYTERQKIEQNRESIYHISINSNLMCNSKQELDRETQILDNTLGGKRMSFMPLYLRMDDGFKSALPLANIYIKDKLRNFNTGALGACFPFYNSEISHEDGVYIGMNLSTGTPMFINFYDENKLVNTNISVFGKAGSGKSFFVSLLTMRSALKGIRTCIIDPEGEYEGITRAMHGIYIKISSETNSSRLNPFDVEETDELDANGNPTGKKVVLLNEKISDVLNLIAVMAGKGFDEEKASLVSGILQNLYDRFGIHENPSSLYYEEDVYDEETKTLYPAGKRKKMPTFTDFCEQLDIFCKTKIGSILQPVANALVMFKSTGINGLFDCQSNIDTPTMNSSLIITFDVSKLEENILRPIGMYVALSWSWEKFGKKNRHIRKRIICDEAWMLVNVNMAGHKYTASFLETCARRIRKRNGGLLVASQNFVEFANSPEGMAVLTNTAVRIFLQQSSTDIDALQEKFKLSNGERNFLTTSQIGQILLKTETDSCIANVRPMPFEVDMINNSQSSYARS